MRTTYRSQVVLAANPSVDQDEGQIDDILRFWNATIRTLMEVFYLLISHSLVILFKHADYPDAIFISPILYVSVLTGLCSFVLNFLMKNYRLVEDRDYQQRFGAFFTNAEIYNNPKAAYYSFVFLLHRFSWLYDYLHGQSLMV